jgi:hypothetical protein
MMDPFDSLLRERITRLLVAVPVGPVPQPSRPPRAGRRMVSRRLVLAFGLGLLLLTSLAVSLPTQSQPTWEARLRALGVPEGVEMVASRGGPGGLGIVYRDADGQVHCAGRCAGIQLMDASGTVLWSGPSLPPPTPGP